MSRIYAFDLDGTMIPGALAEIAFVELSNKGLLHLSTDEIDDVTQLSSTDYNEYVRQAVRKLNQGIKGARIDALVKVADAVAEREAENVFSEIRDELASARKIGAKTVIISASPQLFVSSFARALGVNYAHGAQWHTDNGQVLSDVEQHDTQFDKGSILTSIAHVLRGMPFAAFGDTRNDIPMFKLSERAVAVNPKPDLREKALTSGWEIIDCSSRTRG